MLALVILSIQTFTCPACLQGCRNMLAQLPEVDRKATSQAKSKDYNLLQCKASHSFAFCNNNLSEFVIIFYCWRREQKLCLPQSKAVTILTAKRRLNLESPVCLLSLCLQLKPLSVMFIYSSGCEAHGINYHVIAVLCFECQLSFVQHLDQVSRTSLSRLKTVRSFHFFFFF